MKSLWVVLFLLIPSLALADEPEVVPAELLHKALEWMKSEDPARRKAAYSTMQLLNEDALPKFQTALFAAKSHHEKRLMLTLSGGRDNPYQKLEPLLEELASERERVYALLMIDYKKESSKVKMLRREVESISRIFERASRLAEEDLSQLDEKVGGVAQAIAELSAELNKVESHREGEDYEPDDNSLEELQKDALEDTFDGERYLDFKQDRVALQEEVLALKSARKHNLESSWASGLQKNFAHYLNKERGIMGLVPLHLEEKLSLASADHSKDMKSLGFFAHISPVEGKKGPKDRALKAGYQELWTGENIYMGSGSHVAAYDAWFASDGHRFIMFAKGPNQLGIGPVGQHWTMMTGKK